jgi:streptogramin lyase
VADRDSPDGGGVIRIDPNTGAQKVISDNATSTGAGGQAAFDQPSGIVVNNHGTIYVSDFGAVPSVIRVNPKTGAARGVSSDTMLNEPYDLALSGGDAFVTSTHRILRLSLPGGSQHAFVTGHGLAHPAGIVSTPQGNFLVADQKAAKLYAVNRKTGHIRTVSANSRLQHPFGVGIGLNGFDYVADFGALTLFRINPKTGKAKSVVASGQFNNPLGVGIVPR